MNLMRSLICAAVFALVAAPTWAQNKLDAQALKLYGGTYSSDCSSPAAPRLRVAADNQQPPKMPVNCLLL